MAEYIDKEQIERVRLEDSCNIIEHFKGDEIDCIIDAPVADVIERADYNKLLEENKALKKCITIITNEQLRTAFNIKDLMKEVKKLQEQTRWTEEGLNEWSHYQSILHILERIEENK